MTAHRDSQTHDCHPRPAFTLTELLVVIMIIVLLASLVMFAMAGVQEEAQVKRTRAQIARLNELIMEQWQSYVTRRVPLPAVQNNPTRARANRLQGIRELMRMELPDRITDVTDDPIFLRHRTSASRAYQRRATPGWTYEHQGAECLYLIVARIQVGNSNGLEFFSESEIGDVDGDQMQEILDAWGTPIRWIRWPAGFRSPIQDGIPENGRDSFDLTGLFPENYLLHPLFVSAGPDRLFDIAFDHQTPVQYSSQNVQNDPYSSFGEPKELGQLGRVFDADGDGEDNSLDNIHNHLFLVN